MGASGWTPFALLTWPSICGDTLGAPLSIRFALTSGAFWPVGATLAQFLFEAEPFFCGLEVAGTGVVDLASACLWIAFAVDALLESIIFG